MELKTFITNTLLDIIAGVTEAQQKSGSAQIVPPTVDKLAAVQAGFTPYQKVDFEVLVRIDESKGSEGKIGVVSSIIGASMAGKSANEREHTTSLRFSIPILLPVSQKAANKPLNSDASQTAAGSG